jgi:hypothetical protein
MSGDEPMNKFEKKTSLTSFNGTHSPAMCEAALALGQNIQITPTAVETTQ